MQYNDGEKVYRKSYRKFKKIIKQEIVKKQIKNKVYLYGRKFAIKEKKIFPSPEYLLRKNNTTWVYILIASTFILFSLFAPILFTKFSIYDLTNQDNAIIADTIYGLTGPFIAIAAAFLTYAAFLVQKKANDIQIESTINQIKKDELANFENRLFKLIELHRQNVNELSLILTDSKNGQEVIERLCKNIEIVIQFENWYEKEKRVSLNYTNRDKRVFAYLLICHGKSLGKNSMFKKDPFTKYSNEQLIDYIFDKCSKVSNLDLNDVTIPMFIRRIKNGETKVLDFKYGYMNDLSRYFRQVFQIVKFIDNQEQLTIEQKKEYFKILRTNLSNKDQELLFNNIISPYGKPWEDNCYISTYNIFKNISTYLMTTYTPVDYFKEKYKYDDDKIKKVLDVYEYYVDNEIDE